MDGSLGLPDLFWPWQYEVDDAAVVTLLEHTPLYL